MSSAAGSGHGMSVQQSGNNNNNNYSGTNPHSSNSLTNGSAVPSSQSVQQLSQAMSNQMGNGAGSGGGGGSGSAAQMNAMCVAHSQSAHQLGLHQQLQQRFAAAAAANNNYGKHRRVICQ